MAHGPYDWITGLFNLSDLFDWGKRPRFRMGHGALEILDDDGHVTWRGRPDGRSVKAVFPLEDRLGAIVLLDPDEVFERFRNLLCVDLNGEIVWRAELPADDAVDAYVDAKPTRSGFVANSWSCWRVTIDLSSGEITDREFTK